jgi:hypothetical protein
MAKKFDRLSNLGKFAYPKSRPAGLAKIVKPRITKTTKKKDY